MFVPPAIRSDCDMCPKVVVCGREYYLLAEKIHFSQGSEQLEQLLSKKVRCCINVGWVLQSNWHS